MNWTFWIILGAVLSAAGVAAGAFGAHFLKNRLSSDELSIYETAIRYLLMHSFGLVSLGVIAERTKNRATITLAGWLFFAGIVLFSGSLFLLVVTKIRAFGFITPIGGLCFISGWLAIATAMILERQRFKS